jgi:hypothetical protein
MSSLSVRLVTAAHLPDLAPDDQELLHALQRQELRAEVAVWDDPAVNWSAAPVTIIRSVFGYHLRRDEFIGAVAWAHHRERAGWADESSPCPSIRIEV